MRPTSAELDPNDPDRQLPRQTTIAAAMTAASGAPATMSGARRTYQHRSDRARHTRTGESQDAKAATAAAAATASHWSMKASSALQGQSRTAVEAAATTRTAFHWPIAMTTVSYWPAETSTALHGQSRAAAANAAGVSIATAEGGEVTEP